MIELALNYGSVKNENIKWRVVATSHRYESQQHNFSYEVKNSRELFFLGQIELVWVCAVMYNIDKSFAMICHGSNRNETVCRRLCQVEIYRIGHKISAAFNLLLLALRWKKLTTKPNGNNSYSFKAKLNRIYIFIFHR